MRTEISDIKTNPALLEALKNASTKKITADELQDQRVSFVFGSISSSSNVTKSQVKQFLAAHDGK